MDRQNVSITEGYETIKTYPFSDSNPLPAMAISKTVSSFYPYFMIDGYTDQAVNKNWKVVKLENDFITVTVLPEVGGKVWGAIEKSSGKEFVYLNHVMKFRAIGIRGPWTSGGIEHNFGLDLGHAPWAAASVDYIIVNNPDGSVSCVVGGLDLASRSEWRVKINVPKDKAYFETEALWFNPLPLHQAYLSWENAAFKATDDLQVYFPGNYHIGHDGLASPWPIDSKGRDLSLYKNNNFGGSKSYHVVGDYRNWFGGYWKNLSFGFGHWSPYTDAPGKKLWIWSLAREGGIWEDLLTDRDGQYIEAQSGVKLNQAAEKSGYHSPFRQLSHKPFYAETKTDYWFPVKETGGMVDANIYGTLNVKAIKDSLYVSISPLQQIEDNLVISINSNEVFSEKVNLEPMKTFRRSLVVGANSDDMLTVNLGNRKLYYSRKSESIILRPVRTSDSIKDFNSGERLFRMGEEQNAMRNYIEAMDLYKKCVEKEPTHSEALARIAELYYRKGQYEEGIPYARAVLEFSAYDGAANYIYGTLQDKLNKTDEALEAFSIASRTMEFRSAAYAQIAAIELKKKNFEQAVNYSRKSLDFNKYNLTAASYLISANRKLNKAEKATEAFNELLQIDPLNHYARFEKYLSASDTATGRTAFQSGIQNEFPHETYLELAIQYANTGMYEEAIKALELAPAYPTVYYWLAYLYRNTSKQKSEEYLNKAVAISPWLVFPFRMETMPVLEWARQQRHSWKTVYYSALIQWNNNNLIKAKELFERCGSEPDYAPFYTSRGILLSDDKTKQDDVLKDFKRAILIDPKEWRTWHALSCFYESNGSFSEQFENAKTAYQRFLSNPVISVDYARAMLNVKRPKECIDVLNKTLILPQEGAREGHEIFEMANIALALNNIEQKKHKKAVEYLEQAKQFPEKLGAGKPYDPDYRLQDYLLAYCAKQLGDEQKSMQCYRNIIDFSSDHERFNSAINSTSNYIGILVLDKYGKEKQATELMEGWKHFQDSLSTWHISDFKMSPQMEWVMAKHYNNSTDTKALESKITGAGKESQFTLLLRALKLVEEKHFNIRTFEEPLLPVPQQLRFTDNRFNLDKSWAVNLNGIDNKIPAVLSLQEELLIRYKLKLNTGDGEQNNSISLIIKDGAVKIGNTTDTNRAALKCQAYRLEMSANKITIVANAAQGLFYGVQSLLQLLQEQEEKLFYPEGELTDWPDMNLRMIYWDDAHHLEKPDVLKREIRQASFYKINGFALKLEGHFQYKSAAPIVEPNAMSAAQYQELTDYAAAHYVQLIPYLDAPAHVSFILKHPEYKDLRAFPNSNYQFTVNNPKTYQLLSGMFKELIDANKGVEYVLLSNDEAYYTGKAADEIGPAKSLGGNGKLLAQFIDRMADTLKGYGRKVIFWGEYPLTLDDIKKMPRHLINGVYESSWASAFRERGIRQLIYTSMQGEEPLFPNYYPLPPGKTLHEENAKLTARVPGLLKAITQAVDEKKADLAGVIVAGWADAGLHPQTFWLGYATGAAMGWNHSGANADDLAERFYTTFYRTGNANIKRVYELASRQAQFYEDSWEWEPSDSRTPIFGNSADVFVTPKPALDQRLLMLPTPDSNDLSLKFNWADSNNKRLQLAQSFLKENDELTLLLNNLNVENNQYNIEVIKTVASLCRQNISMLLYLKKISELLQSASEMSNKNPENALSMIDQSLNLAALIKRERNNVLDSSVNVWYNDWLPLVSEANGRKYLHAMDDVKDHRPLRTADMSYLIYRELKYPMDKWADEIVKTRNEFAHSHSLKQRVFNLKWKEYTKDNYLNISIL